MVCRSLLFAATCYAIFVHLSETQLVLEADYTEDAADECLWRANLVKDANMNTTLEFPPPLTGKWVSKRCETRHGPQYLLRSYTFYPDNSFHLIQFFYSDESCSSIKYTITAFGTYRMKSRPSTPSPTKLTYDLSKVTVVVHDIEVSRNLSKDIKSECPGTAVSFWRPLTEYVIFEQQTKKNQISRNAVPPESFQSREHSRKTRTHDKYEMQSDTDPRCLLMMLGLSYEELHALRVRTRFTADGLRYELLLAKTHLYQERRQPIQDVFQLPLVLVNETQDCHVCNLVSRSTNMFVHPLFAKPRLRLHLNGEWISDTCEERSWRMLPTRNFGAIDERPMQLFSTRSFRVSERFRHWELETKYYSDYRCSAPVMVQQSYGSYYYHDKFSEKVGGAVEVKFEVEKSYLLIWEETVLNRIRTEPMCSYSNYWTIGVKKEVPPRYACSNIGITSSPVKYNIARLDTDEKGFFLLYLGDEDTNFDRPTGYEYPLVQCSLKSNYYPSSSTSQSTDSATLRHSSSTVTLLAAIYWLVNSS